MPTHLKTIYKLRVPVIVQIGTRPMPMSEVLAMGPGSIIELSKSADDELDVLINNKPVAAGKAMKVGENFGICILDVGTPEDRIQAMGG